MQLGDGDGKTVQPCSHSPLYHTNREDWSSPCPAHRQFPDGGDQTSPKKGCQGREILMVRFLHLLAKYKAVWYNSQGCALWVSLQASLCKACHGTATKCCRQGLLGDTAARTAGHSPGLQNPSPEDRTLDCSSRE